MRKKRILSLILVLMMLVSQVPVAMAADLDEVLSNPTKSPTGTNIAGMLALEQYVFVKSEGEVLGGGTVSTGYYGVYTGSEAADKAAFVPAEYEGDVNVYLDSAMTNAATGVTAAISDDALTMTGVSTTENVAYYLTIGSGAYTTVIYVVNDEYSSNTARLYLADETYIDLTKYAPNLANGNYYATEADVNGDGSVYIGGNKTIRTAADYGITGSNAAAVNWYLQSGITNAGDTLTEFGDKMYGFDYAMSIYRMFQIVIDQITTYKDFVDFKDYAGGMGNNDSYSDSVSTTLYAGIWNGIYTEMTSTMDSGSGFYLLDNIRNSTDPIRDSDEDGVTDMLGTGAVVDIEFAYVGMYNAFASNWTMLNSSTGVGIAEDLEDAAAYYDGDYVTAPVDYSNEAKIYAVATELLGLDATPQIIEEAEEPAEEPAGDPAPATSSVPVYETPEQALIRVLNAKLDADVTDFTAKLTKLEVVSLLYAASGSVQSKTPPDGAWAAQTGSIYSDMTLYFAGDYDDTQIITGLPATVSSSLIGTGTSLLLNNIGGIISGTLTITDKTISTTGSSAADNAFFVQDLNTSVDGAELSAPPFAWDSRYNPDNGGWVYNAIGRNAYYRDAIGSGMAVWGNSTIAKLTTTNGTLVLDGAASGSMAGTAYVGFGGSMLVENAVAYSAGQHLTNLLFNGTIHYKDSYAIGSGRAYSSDFWGGYMVFEDSVVTGRSGQFTDEPTSIVVKNSVFDATLQGTGMASQYFENSILNTGTVTYSNNTSGMSDTASLTIVNSVVNNSGSAFAGTNKGNRAIVTFVDSDITLNGTSLANVTVRSTEAYTTSSVEAGEEDDFAARYNGEMAYYIYGNNTITTTDGTLTASIADGAKLTIYGNIVDEKGNTININGATQYTSGYGTLTVKNASPTSGSRTGSSSGTTTSAVTVSSTENGTVTVSPKNPSNGSEVTVTVTPNNGYELDSLTITDSTGKKLSYTDNGDGTYTFTYGGNAVTIDAVFKAVGSDDGADSGLPFKDVASGDWYYEAVEYVYKNGLFNGVSATEFEPNGTMTRAMLVTVLWRYEGEPSATSANPFKDVQGGQWYTDAVIWAAANEIIDGYGNGNFGPNDSVTREQMAAIFMRYADWKGLDVSETSDLAGFSDAGNISDWALDSVKWAHAAGLIEGTTTTTIVPGGVSTRAQVATVLMRFIEKYK